MDAIQQHEHVVTYHCQCLQLVLASTTPLQRLPRRKDTTDRAFILTLPPLPPDPRSAASPSPSPPTSPGSNDDKDEAHARDNDTTAAEEPGVGSQSIARNAGSANSTQIERSNDDSATRRRKSTDHYALLLSAAPDRRAQIVRRADGGYEARYGVHCARCRVPFGYQLDWAQYPSEGNSSAGNGHLQLEAETVVETETGSDLRTADKNTLAPTGRRLNLVYVLPDALIETDVLSRDMAKLGP